jgi:hypothetical protein
VAAVSQNQNGAETTHEDRKTITVHLFYLLRELAY